MIPYNPDVVLEKLPRPETPPPPPWSPITTSYTTPRQLLSSSLAKTPSNPAEYQRITDKIVNLLDQGATLSVNQVKKVTKMVVTANKEVIDNCLLRNQIKELHTNMNNKAKRRNTRREHLQKGGVLAVEDGQQMVLDRQGRAKKQTKRAQEQAERAIQTSQTATLDIIQYNPIS
jgi:hypothetical protein